MKMVRINRHNPKITQLMIENCASHAVAINDWKSVSGVAMLSIPAIDEDNFACELQINFELSAGQEVDDQRIYSKGNIISVDVV